MAAYRVGEIVSFPVWVVERRHNGVYEKIRRPVGVILRMANHPQGDLEVEEVFGPNETKPRPARRHLVRRAWVRRVSAEMQTAALLVYEAKT